MRALEFITELFQPGKQWQWGFRGSEEAHATFIVNNIEYYFRIYRDANNDIPNTWEVEFGINGSGNYDTKYGITGTGNAAIVMSIVADIIRNFLTEYQDNVQAIKFTAKEPSRKFLYMRMVKRLLPKWKVKIDKYEDNAYTVIRPKQRTK
jgi:hypothetical protein